MIESVDVAPGFHTVTGFAAEWGAVGSFACHLLIELLLMGVLMASHATPAFKMERQDFVSTPTQANLVAIRARNCRVRSLKREPRIAVLRNREARTMPILDGVAILAAVVVGRRSKLMVVRILVAIQAGRQLHLVDSVFARRNMAFCALHLGVLATQRILRSVVFLDAKQRRFPTINGVTLGALSLFGPAIELSFMWVRSVAILATGKRNLFLEIVFEMASRASHLRMFAKERIFCF